jgi:NodT family efflux transporter outer membrane factor (OMF) lipoprotein
MTRRRTFRAVLLLTPALAAGCAVGPDFLRPGAPEVPRYTEAALERLPAAGNEVRQRLVAGAEVSGTWWKLFRSPELDRVLDLAVANSPTLEAQQATLRQAREQVTAAAGPLFPQLDVTADASRSKGRATATGRGTISNSFSIGPIVGYDLDVFGRTRRAVEQADALAEFQRYQLAAAYLALTGNAVGQALTIASIRAQLAAQEDIVALDRRTLELTRLSFEGGRSARADVLSAESQVASDLTQFPALNQQLAVARHALSVLVGRAPAEWSPPDFDLERLALPEELPLAVPSELVRRRPDILAAEAQLHASSAAVGVATANLYPSFDLSASWTRVAAFPSALFDPTSTIWSLGAGLVAPLFHGGELRANRRAAVAAFEADLALYRDTMLQAFGQVADVLRALEHDAELLEAQRNALVSAEASLALIQESFEVGQASLLQVLDAQRLFQQARLGYARARAQRYLDTAQLFAAMGGAWEAYAPANSPSP